MHRRQYSAQISNAACRDRGITIALQGFMSTNIPESIIMNRLLRLAIVSAMLMLLYAPFSRSVHDACAQEKKKGDLEDFADDFGDEESDDDGDSDDSSDFFLWLFFDNIDDFIQLWGGTPGTAFGPFPSHPYAADDGFMVNADEFRSYFFNTEFSYHYLHENLQSFIFKWETQFAHKSKLSFDVAFYEETVHDDAFSFHKDYLTYWGARYGYAIVRTPQMLVNVEGGIRGFTRNRFHSGPEVALDLQLFPRRPLILETEVAAAYVTGGPLYTVESSIGVALGRFELLAGLRLLKNRSADLLDGFRVGLRIWY